MRRNPVDRMNRPSSVTLEFPPSPPRPGRGPGRGVAPMNSRQFVKFVSQSWSSYWGRACHSVRAVGLNPPARSGRNKLCQVSRATPLVSLPDAALGDGNAAARRSLPLWRKLLFRSSGLTAIRLLGGPANRASTRRGVDPEWPPRFCPSAAHFKNEAGPLLERCPACRRSL